MLRRDFDARANVPRHEFVVKDGDLWSAARPFIVLELDDAARGQRNNDVRRMRRVEPTAACDDARIVLRERAEHCGERGLAPAVLGIDQRQAIERRLRRGLRAVELADVTQKLEPLSMMFPMRCFPVSTARRRASHAALATHRESAGRPELTPNVRL